MLCMNNKEYVDILNGMIDNIGVEGFWFDRIFDSIILRIPFNRYDENSVMKYDNGFGYWRSMDEMFMDVNCGDIRFILECIGKLKGDVNGKNEYICDYLSINDVGIDFLECVLDSGSLDEVKLKLQIMGYDV